VNRRVVKFIYLIFIFFGAAQLAACGGTGTDAGAERINEDTDKDIQITYSELLQQLSLQPGASVGAPTPSASSISSLQIEAFDIILEPNHSLLPTEQRQALAACQNLTAGNSGEILFIASERVDCQGLIPQKCLQTRSDENADWEFFYDEIEGFEHEVGYRYKLLVEITEVDNPPQDASSLRYQLIKVLEKK
jgi:hypothetical protein